MIQFAPLQGTGSLTIRPVLPQPADSEVSVRLFAAYSFHSLWLKSSTDFVISKHRVRGPLYISIVENKISLRSAKGWRKTAARLTVSSPESDFIEVKRTWLSSKRTSGKLTFRVVKGQIQVINQLDLEDYVKGIVEPELGTLNLNPEVIKAQIIAARSYVLSMRKGRHFKEGYEFCDSPHCQAFGGLARRNPRLDQAAAAVKGEYLSYQGHPIPGFYHHDCGGATAAIEDVWPEAPKQPYLHSVKEDPRGVCRLSEKFQWHFTVSQRSLVSCFRNAGWLKKRDALDSLRVVKTDRSGRAQQILVQSNKGRWIPISRFRNTINHYYGSEVLKSALFTLTQQNGKFVFTGRGWGHGVGLCQEGAKEMANQGKSYRQILIHYFPGTRIANLRSSQS